MCRIVWKVFLDEALFLHQKLLGDLLDYTFGSVLAYWQLNRNLHHDLLWLIASIIAPESHPSTPTKRTKTSSFSEIWGLNAQSPGSFPTNMLNQENYELKMWFRYSGCEVWRCHSASPSVTDVFLIIFEGFFSPPLFSMDRPLCCALWFRVHM